MKTLKSNSKKAIEFVNRYNKSNATELWQVYNSYSHAKEVAMLACKQLMLKEDGFGLRIISSNTFGFSVMWINHNGYRIETPKSSYRIIDDLPF